MSCVCFTYIGYATVAFVVYKIVIELFKLVKAHLLSSGVDLKKFGKWALVTGCTDGIGRAYATQLAKRGLNVVLISRSSEKLRELATEIETKYHVETSVLAVDFTNSCHIYDQIAKHIESLDIGILINNVGMSSEYPEKFLSIPDARNMVANIINVNLHSVVQLTAIVMPKMVENKRGLVVNISSASALYPLPYLQVYGASKAFVHYLTKTLQVEYANSGVIVQGVMPFFVATKMSKLRPSFLTPTADSYVKEALATVGQTQDTTGCLAHGLQSMFVRTLYALAPSSYVNSMLSSKMEFTRQRALKRRADTAKPKTN